MNTSAPTVVVTGGTSGIGAAVAQKLLSRGYAVLITGRDPIVGQRLATDLGQRCLFARADHAEDHAPEDVLEAYDASDRALFGPLVGLVNNVGRRHNDLIGEHSAQRLSGTFALNVNATILMTQAVAPRLAAAGGGAVVNVSSRLAVAGMAGVSGYAASKGAVNAFTIASAIELAPKRIRVNAVAPGMTKTPLIEAWLAEQPDPARAEAEQAGQVPLGRLCTVEDVAKAICFLVSDEASFITGAILPVDGGYTAA